MNVILFGLKRAFQSSIRFTRPLVGAFGLTAARFDMLYAIKKSYRRAYDPGIRQSVLRRTLGVTAPTVSRMLRSLEKLGLVRRIQPRKYGDRRQRIVSITPTGLACMRRAFKSLVRSGVIQRAFNRVLTIGRPYRTWFAEMATADSFCSCVRQGFGDTATLYYPWHPDD